MLAALLGAAPQQQWAPWRLEPNDTHEVSLQRSSNVSSTPSVAANVAVDSAVASRPRDWHSLLARDAHGDLILKPVTDMSFVPSFVLVALVAIMLLVEVSVGAGCPVPAAREHDDPTNSSDPSQQKTGDTTPGYDAMEKIELKKRVPLIANLALMSLSMDLVFTFVVTYLPTVAADKGASQTAAGFVFGCFGLGMMAGAFFAPFLLRVIAPLRVVKVAQLASALASATFGLATMFDDPSIIITFMCLCRLVNGFAVATNEVTCQALIYRMVAETQIASVNAMIWSIRMLGMFSAPMLGAVFYSVGGAPAPTLVVAGVAAVLYLYSACFQMPRLPFDLQPPANPDQASVFDLWRVGPVWLVQAVGVLCLSCLLSYEPLLNPVLSGPPFNLSYTEIGVFALIGPICSTLAAAFCARMYRSIGKTNQLWLAAVCLLFAVACYGPSRLLPLPNSFPLMVTYFVVVSVGNMIGLSILPVLLLDILWSQARMTKKQAAGALMSTSLLSMYVTGFVSPTISSYVYDATNDVGLWSTYLFVFELVCWPPVIFLLGRSLTNNFGESGVSGYAKS